MCAKAIRDGVIEASLNHDDGYLASSTSGNVYSTTQPQEQFHQRIEFCLSYFFLFFIFQTEPLSPFKGACSPAEAKSCL